MNISAQIQQSVHIITEYYENRLQPFFDAIDDDLLWIGPAERQWMQEKYLKRLHSGGGETPSDIPDEQYPPHNLLRNSCLRDHSDLSRVYILSNGAMTFMTRGFISPGEIK
ncbi:MAG: hypothetical protein ACLVBJ_08090 [Pilosibacter sp.]